MQLSSIKRSSITYAMLAMVIGCLMWSFSGATAQAVVSAEITQGFLFDGEVVPGALVSVAGSDSKKVEIADADSGERLIGIMVTPNESTIAVSATDNAVQIATTGKTIVLVSTVDGDIRAGDVLGLSSIKGVASKATPGARIVGIADASFDETSPGSTKREIVDSGGNKHTVTIGSVPITMSIGSTMPMDEGDQGEDVLGWVSTLLGEKVTGARFALAGVVAVIMVVATSVMIYGSVRNTIYGISRNPMAKASIFEALGEVIMMVVGIAILGTALIYVILKI